MPQRRKKPTGSPQQRAGDSSFSLVICGPEPAALDGSYQLKDIGQIN
jgi:hypothetical protein